MKKRYIQSALVLAGVIGNLAYSAAPVGDTIWLYHDVNGSYVTVDASEGYRLAANNTTSVGDAEKFMVEDAGGGNILLMSVLNSNHVRVDTANVDKLYADTNTVDVLYHFTWTDLPGGKVRLTSVGDTDGNANVSPTGAAQVLRSNVSSTDSLSEFSWGVLGATGVTVPNVVDLSQSAAQTAIEGAGLLLGTVSDVYSSTITVSNVVSQNPAGGANVASNTAVDLAISIGPDPTPSMIQYLFAAATNVVGNPVTQWIDRSGAGNDALPADGSVAWPSASVSGSGLPGLDFGIGANSMELFSGAESDAWLDFTGAASGNSGFCVLMAFRVDGFNTENMDLIGNSSAIGSGFCMRLLTDGSMKAWVEGSSTVKALGKAAIRDTMVIALNYNALTGGVEFWDSNSGSAAALTAVAADSSGGDVTVGKTTGSGRYFIGMVGEVKVFSQVLDAMELTAETAAMVKDWVTVTEIKVPEELTTVSALGEVQLDWLDDISGDLFAGYSVYRSTESGSNYVQIASNLTESAYVDTTGDAGVPYYYVVTAVDTNGVGSGYSNEAGGASQVLSVLQRLDASVASNVLTSANVVTQWVDRSVNGNDAVASAGSVLYPSTLTSASGLTGMDMRGGLDTLQLFSEAGSDGWLDQSISTNGFCVMVAFTCDDLVPGVDNDLIGNSSDGSTGFGMRYTAAGEIQAFLGGQQIVSGGHPVEGGDTLVFALNYNAVTGTYDFWDSKNYTVVSGTRSKTDFSTANPVILGGSVAGGIIDGMVGEVVVYDEALSPEHFKVRRDQLTQKWLRRPNIVLIYVDDWAWNGTPIRMDERMQNSSMPDMIEMPNLQTMAAHGMVFRNAYGSPQCSPARAALHTGQSNPHNGFTVFMGNSSYYDTGYPGFPVVPNGADSTLDPDAVTIPEALAPLGYASALFGKWHNRGDPEDEYGEGNAPFGDTANGPGQTVVGNTLNGIIDPKRMSEITSDGIAFMEKQVADGNPFFVMFSHFAMHEGRECFPSSRARYQNIPEIVAYNGGETNPDNINHKGDPAVWLGMAYELDQKIGKVKQKLVDLGIDDNTYVIVVSDNGYREDFFDEVAGLSQPLHAHKWMLWQAGIRVPMIATGPGIEAGSYCTANVVNYDFLPTFFDWAGGDPDELADIDGISLAGLMEGKKPDPDFLNRSLYFHYPHYRDNLPHTAIVKGHEKVVYFYETPVTHPGWEPIMYFDLDNDAGEYHNIYPENPARAQELYADLTNYLAAVGARIPQVPNPDYDPAIYAGTDPAYLDNAKDYAYRVLRGPFIGTRAAEDDEFGPVTFADYWMDSYGLDRSSETNDFDGDGLANLAEYALGGDPTDKLNMGFVPVLGNDGGSLTYNYLKRNDDSSLTYTVESSTNLLTGPWVPAGGSEDVNQTAGELDDVVHSVPVDEPQSYIRLKISTP